MESLLFLFFILFLILIVLPLVAGILIPTYKSHDEVTGGIINYDSAMKKFVYKINLSNEQVIELLNMRNVLDELSCTFDLDNSIIRFSEYGSHSDYYFQVQQYDDVSILKLEQVEFIGMQNQIPFKLNPFIVNKLQAEIIPFSQYGF